MNAPFFNDPPNPGGPAGEPFPGLWEYEGNYTFFVFMLSIIFIALYRTRMQFILIFYYCRNSRLSIISTFIFIIVVEIFFLNDLDHYIELEFCP